MFRKMRRSKQELPKDECIRIIESGQTCIMAVQGDDGYPYAVPLNYCCYDGKIYIHCATEGHKLDGIKRNDEVSLCIIDNDEIEPELYTDLFCSVIIFGRARITENPDEKIKALKNMAQKYCSGHLENLDNEIKTFFDRTAIIEITPEHITGKGGMDYLKRKNSQQ